jgi:ATP-dependent DNA ligase
MLFEGRDVKTETLDARRDLMERRIVPELTKPVRYADRLEASLRDLLHSVKVQRLEGLVANRRDSRYEPGLRSGAWMKMRINQGQEFVIGGYTVGTRTFRRADYRVLRRRSTDLHSAHTKRLHTCGARATLQTLPSTRNS